MPEPHRSIVPAWTFRPMTRSAMVLERLAADSGYSVPAILSHVRHCPFRCWALKFCKTLMFGPWETDHGDGRGYQPNPDFGEKHWPEYSEIVFADFGLNLRCPNCDVMCHPVLIAREKAR